MQDFRGCVSNTYIVTMTHKQRDAERGITMENLYNVSREDLISIIIALGRAECWLIELANKHTKHESNFMDEVTKTLELEMRLRDLVKCSFNEAI